MEKVKIHQPRDQKTRYNSFDSLFGRGRPLSPVNLSLLVTLSILLIASDSEAKIYKWVDSNGITQYTQHPPPIEFDIREIETQSQPSNQAARAQKALTKRLAALEERRGDKQLAEDGGKAAVEHRQKVAEYCTASKKRLVDFQSSRRLVEQKSDGTYKPISDKNRAEQIARMQADIKRECS